MTDPRICIAVRQVVELLVAGEYEQVAIRSGHKRLSSHDLERAVREYGRRLAMPPFGADSLDIVYVANAVLPSWSIRVDLWTVEEGRSDLTLELTVIDEGKDTLKVEVDNLHVL